MKKVLIFTLVLIAGFSPLSAQQEIPQITALDIEALPEQSRHQFWLEMVDDGMGRRGGGESWAWT